MSEHQAQHRVCVAGASGRMGQMLVDAVRASGDCTLSGALDVAASPAIGQDAGAFRPGRPPACHHGRPGGWPGRQPVPDRLHPPEGTMAAPARCVKQGVNLVIGTTGFSDEQKAEIADAAAHPSPSSWRPT
jgi:4-hydroxy-tetrahydrodipicolinate reductase